MVPADEFVQLPGDPLLGLVLAFLPPARRLRLGERRLRGQPVPIAAWAPAEHGAPPQGMRRRSRRPAPAPVCAPPAPLVEPPAAVLANSPSTARPQFPVVAAVSAEPTAPTAPLAPAPPPPAPTRVSRSGSSLAPAGGTAFCAAPARPVRA